MKKKIPAPNKPTGKHYKFLTKETPLSVGAGEQASHKEILPWSRVENPALEVSQSRFKYVTNYAKTQILGETEAGRGREKQGLMSLSQTN